jgi:protein-tyrosine phosphatase
MIDIHCHILPDYDDGAADLEEALEMVRMATLSGVTDIIATPHFQGEEAELERLDIITRQYQVLKAAIEQRKLSLKLHLGAEILCVPETLGLADQRQLPTLAGTDYVLTEFYFDESYAFMDDMLSQIASCGYRPVVAHPERYDVIQREPPLLRRWARQGYVIQLNKGSVLGSFGPGPEWAANEILGMGLAHVFASDAHSCHSRTPHMGALQEWVNELCDPDYAAILLEENPRRLLRGLPMVGADP